MKFKRTWITGILCNRMIRSWIFVLPCSYRRMMSFGILLLMLVFCDPQLDMQWKLSTYYLEKLQLSPPQKLPVSYVFLRSGAHYLLSIWDHKLVSDVSAPPDFWKCKPLLKFRLLVRLCPLHSLLGCIHKIWNYEGRNLRSNFVTEFVDPVENTGILLFFN